MKLTYADIALHSLGNIYISSQQATGEPEEAPQRWKHKLVCKIKTAHGSYSDNLDVIAQMRAALQNQESEMLNETPLESSPVNSQWR